MKNKKNNRLICRYSDERLFQKWISGKEITRYCYNRDEDVPKFLATGRTTIGYPNSKSNEPPFMDHIAYYKNTRTNQVWLTSQPYFKKVDVENEVRIWANNYGVDYEVYDMDESWYFPGNTCLIVYTIKK